MATSLGPGDLLIAHSSGGFVAPVTSTMLRITRSGWAEYERIQGADRRRSEHRFSAADLASLTAQLHDLPPALEPDVVIDDAPTRTLEFHRDGETRRIELETHAGERPYPALATIEALWASIHAVVAGPRK